jgi:hypothetical protein
MFDYNDQSYLIVLWNLNIWRKLYLNYNKYTCTLQVTTENKQEEYLQPMEVRQVVERV